MFQCSLEGQEWLDNLQSRRIIPPGNALQTWRLTRFFHSFTTASQLNPLFKATVSLDEQFRSASGGRCLTNGCCDFAANTNDPYRWPRNVSDSNLTSDTAEGQEHYERCLHLNIKLSMRCHRRLSYNHNFALCWKMHSATTFSKATHRSSSRHFQHPHT